MSGPVAVHAAVRAAPVPAPSLPTAGARVLQRCPGGSCADEDELLREAAGPGPAVAPRIVHEVLASAGRPLDPPVRASLERRLGHDFGSVRVHTDARAAESARAVEALAYTVGRDVVFGAGRYAPGTPAGSRLLAHELAHVVQQRGREPRGGELRVLPAGSALEQEADALAAGASTVSALARPALQRQPPTPAAPPPPVCPARVTISSDPAHVPSCGPLTAASDVAGVTWTLEPDPTALDTATAISTAGAITIAPTQAAGQIKAVATDASGTCNAFQPLRIRSHPTGIASTSVVSQPGAPLYGGRFDHVFTSNDGSVSSLDNVAVGERFIGVPTPAAATHAIAGPTWPFGGTFTLDTATLKSDATDNWFLTSAGGLNGNQDNVDTERADINVGRFIRSASNPTPPQALPADMTLRQGLHWFCPQAAAASRWRMPGFVTVAHSRTLRDRSGTVEFVTTVNGVEIVEAYDGPVGVFNATPSPVSTPRSPAAGPARTVAITVSTLPAALPTGQTLTFSLVSGPAGSSVAADPANDHGAILTVGTEAGSAVVDVQDSTGTNRARATVTIT